MNKERSKVPLSKALSYMNEMPLEEAGKKEDLKLFKKDQASNQRNNNLQKTKSSTSIDDRTGLSLTSSLKMVPSGQSEIDEKLSNMLGPTASGFRPSNRTNFHQQQLRSP